VLWQNNHQRLIITGLYIVLILLF